MVKKRRRNTKKKLSGKGFNSKRAKARKTNDSKPYETCSGHSSPLGGLLGVGSLLKKC